MLGKTLIELREKHGMSQQDLADQLNLAKTTVANWEAELSMPSIEQSKLIAKVFDVTLDELVG